MPVLMVFEDLGPKPYQLTRFGKPKRDEFYVPWLDRRLAYRAHQDLESEHWIAEVKQ